MTTFLKRLSGLLAGVISISGLALCCTEENSTAEPFAVYYSGLTEISPGTNANITPTWKGSTPEDFSITSIYLDGITYSSECFSVDSSSGLFSLRGSDDLPTGTYRISISCVSDGVRYNFKDAIVIEMMKPVPSGIAMSPESLTVSADDVMAEEGSVSLPTSSVTTDGSHVTIKSYAISAVYLNGEADETYKSWFAISSSGEVSIVAGNTEIIPGIYCFDLKLNTYIAGSNSELGLFRNALKINVIAPPLRT